MSVSNAMLLDDGIMYRRESGEASLTLTGAFRELQIVRISKEVETEDGEKVSSGTCGTIVGVWGQGEAYEVEFIDPIGVATIRADGLSLIEDAAD